MTQSDSGSRTASPPLPSRITVLSGGVGGARFLQGLRHLAPTAQITVIANTADDLWIHGLKVCPDLDTIMYTLGGGIDTQRGWGREDETWNLNAELAAYGMGQTWFSLGDRDLATHVVRTQMLENGYTLSAVTEALCDRWNPGVHLVPMTDDRVETHIVIDDETEASGRRAVHFQEYWVRLRASVPARTVVVVGNDAATPSPGAYQALRDTDLIIIPPSNPVVSIGTILGVPGLRQALRNSRAKVVGLSPLIEGRHVHGMAEQLLDCLGVEKSAAGVGLHYGARPDGGVLDGWLIDTADHESVAPLQAAGLRAGSAPLRMDGLLATAAMAQAAWALVC